MFAGLKKGGRPSSPPTLVGGGSVTAKISIHHGDSYASLEGTADVIKWPNQSGWRSLWRPNGQLAQTRPQKAQEATTVHARTTPAVVDVKTVRSARRALQQASSRSSKFPNALGHLRPGGQAERGVPRPPVRAAVWSSWAAAGQPGYSGSSAGRSVMDLCMSGIACQKEVKIYRQRPRPVNALSRFVACFFHLLCAPPTRSPPTRH